MDRTEELRQKLTPKELAFAHLVIDGLPKVRAYKAAISTDCKDGAASASATRLLKKDKISAYIEHIKELTTSGLVYSRQQKRERLYTIGEGLIRDVKPTDRIQAIKADNQMTGDDAPVRIEGEITLGGILSGLQPTTGLPSKD